VNIPTSNPAEARAQCLRLARGHYENFPVASWLLPRRLRPAVAALYAFARTADDWADEGDLPEAERLRRLDDWGRRLHALERGGDTSEPVLAALAWAVRRHALPWAPLHDLLSAFRQDVTRRRYDTWAELQDYCRRSANPVGRLLLHLYKCAGPRELALSDDICTALQLVNFLQDLASDYHERGRIYLPREELDRFGVTEAHFRERRNDAAMRALLRFQIHRARSLLCRGAPLVHCLPRRAGLELRAIVAGGLQVLRRLERTPHPFARPRLGWRDAPALAWLALASPCFRHGHRT